MGSLMAEPLEMVGGDLAGEWGSRPGLGRPTSLSRDGETSSSSHPTSLLSVIWIKPGTCSKSCP